MSEKIQQGSVCKLRSALVVVVELKEVDIETSAGELQRHQVAFVYWLPQIGTAFMGDCSYEFVKSLEYVAEWSQVVSVSDCR